MTSGSVYVAYASFTRDSSNAFVGYNIWISKSTDGGNSFQPEYYTSNPSSSQKRPVRIYATSTKYYVLFVDETNNNLYFHQGSGNSILNNATKVNAGNGTSLYGGGDIAIAPNGSTIYIVFADATGDPEGNITFCKSTDTGATWGSCVMVNDNQYRWQYAPSIALDSFGVLHAIWTDLRSNSKFQTYYARSTDASTFSSNVNISADQPGVDFQQPHLALDNTNSLLYVSSTKNVSQVVLSHGAINLPPPSIAIGSASPSSVTLIAGASSQNITVNITRNNYSGNVTLGVGTLPSGVTAVVTSPGSGSSATIGLTAVAGAPTTANQTISITCSGQGINAVSSSFTLNVNQSLAINGPTTLSAGTVGVSYPSTIVTATGGTGSYIWSSTGLPAGLSINANTGTITGTPTSATGSPFSVTITVRDAASVTASRVYSLTINPPSTSTTLAVSPKTLNFGFNGSLVTHSQNATLTFTGASGVGWTATSSQPNITVSPTSGTGTATITVTGAAGPSGVVTITAPAASNSPQTIQVNVTNTSTGGPFGSFDTPINNTTGISGAVAVTGWALDSIEVTRVDIFREPIVGEPAGNLIFIGTAVFVADARPDVQNQFPTYPYQYRAGWGYQMLTNFLPNASGSGASGNGTYRLHAIAFNKAGMQQDLGTKTIVVDNAHAAKPFGTIDTPGQGGTISGTDSVNFGWTLTPQPAMIPTNGSTITVVIDGVPVGQPTYNQFRSDVANLFPGYANSGGAVGFFHINTTLLANGVHTISWNVFDNLGRGEGLGSRYFNVLNTGGGSGVAARENVINESVARKSVRVRHNLNINRPPELLVPDADGGYSVTMEEMGRIELHVGATRGNLLVQGEAHPLPAGSTLKSGIFYWQPGPGFLGEYTMQFERPDRTRITVRVKIVPKRY